MEACEPKAITLRKGIPVFSYSDCTECGKCISACPVQAVAGIFPKRQIAQNQLIATTEKESPSAKELLIYYKKGIKSIACETEKLSSNWEKAINEANHILEKLDESPFHVVFRKIDRKEEKYTRRELFFSWRTETQELMKEMVPAKWRFNQNDLDLAKYYPEHQFTEITLDINKCVLCKACQVLCNKGSLKIREDSFSIVAQTCSSCKLCQDICPEEAISVQNKVMANQPVEYPIYKKTCRSCQDSFYTLTERDEECIKCVKRKEFLMTH
jgi:ferredoxin